MQFNFMQYVSIFIIQSNIYYCCMCAGSKKTSSQETIYHKLLTHIVLAVRDLTMFPKDGVVGNTNVSFYSNKQSTSSLLYMYSSLGMECPN